MRRFQRYIGIDYSGGEDAHRQPERPAGLSGRYAAMPADVLPPPLLPPISLEDIELLCWLGIESDGEGTPLQEVGSGK